MTLYPMLQRSIIAIFVAIAVLAMGCGSSRPTLSTAPATEQRPESREPNPRAVDLVIRGSLEELMGNDQAALLAYQEAQLYDSTSVGLYIAIARTYQRLHKIESALKVLHQALRRDPDNRKALESLALLYEFRRDYPAALKIYEKLARIAPYDIEVRVRLATLYAQMKEFDRAILHFQRLVDLGQGGPQIWRPLGRLYLEKKEYEKARAVFSDWVEDDPYNEEAYLELGLVYKAQDDTTGLIEWYRKALEEHPEFQFMREELTNLLVETGKLDEAITLFESQVAADSSDFVRVSQLGNLYLQKGDTLKAQKLFEFFLEKYPDDWRAYYNMGRLSYDRRQWRETAEFLQKALQHNSRVPQVWIMLAQAFWRMDSVRRAEAALDSVWSSQSRNPQVWLLLAQTYFQMQKLERAEKAARRAHRLAPELHFTNYFLGLILSQMRRNEEAVPFLEMALKTDSTDVNTLGLLASVYADLERYEESYALYEKALKLEPDNPILQNNYSYGLAVRGVQLDRALELVERALEKQPQNPAFLDTKGWVLYQMGRYEEALDWIQRSLKLRDSSAEVWEHLGDVYDKLGRPEEAARAWRKAYDLDNSRETVLKKLNLNKN